jgi:hypothetical protein
MKYEGNPSYEKTSSYYLNTYYWKTRAQFVECARETLPEYIGVDDRTVYAQIISKYPVYEKQIEENYIREKTSFTDGEKYFALSYCYVTGYDGTPKDIGKAVQLCQKAASGYTYHSRAREILKKAGFSWTD